MRVIGFVIVGALGCTRLLAQDSLSLRVADYIRRGESTYRVVERDIFGVSTEGGHITAYFDGDSLVWVVAKLYGEMGRSRVQAYWHHGVAILAVDTTESYDEPLSGRVSGTETHFWARDPASLTSDAPGDWRDTLDAFAQCARSTAPSGTACDGA